VALDRQSVTKGVPDALAARCKAGRLASTEANAVGPLGHPIPSGFGSAALCGE